MVMSERVPGRAPDPEGEPEWTDDWIVAGVRRGERAALERLYATYEPFLTRLAGRLGVAPGERRMAAVEVLGDAALALMRRGVASPRHLPSYLGTSLRHWVEMRHRAGASYQRWCEAAAGSDGAVVREEVRARRQSADPARQAATGEGIVTSVVSEYVLRASTGPGATHPPTHPAILALAGKLDQLLREDERYLLVWTSHGVPVRVAAEWLGLSQSVAAKRLSRLRTRLRATAVDYADTIAADDRRYLHRFFARATAEGTGGTIDDDIDIRNLSRGTRG